MILSTYERKDSLWVWIQFTDPRTGLRKMQRTDVRKDDPDKIKKTALAKNKMEAKMLEGAPREAGPGGGWGWPQEYLLQRYRARARTLQVYRTQWKWLEQFFAEARIGSPASLTREDCYAYLDWRTNQVKPASGRSPGINTACSELKLLGLIMGEAMKRGMVLQNVAAKLGIERAETGVKPEITREEEAAIRAALAKEPEWMRRSFALAIGTGMRFSETRLHRTQVRWSDEMIILEKPKGGKARAFAIPIYPAVRPLLEEWRAEGTPYLWNLPPKTLVGLELNRFFKPFVRQFEKPGLCFHCTRVTFVTRGMRAGIPESVMCRMVNHGSTLVNRIYQRWTSEDVRRYAALIPGNQGATGE